MPPERRARRRTWATVTALAGLLLAPLAAAAQGLEAPPQQLTWPEVAASPHMHFAAIRRPDGVALLAWGGIGAGDADRLAGALDRAGPLLDVEFFSPGGLLDEGLHMGYLLRQRGLATHLAAGTICASACNFAFMGGVIRSIDPGARFEVHMFEAGNALARAVAANAQNPPQSIGDYNSRYPDAPLDPAQVQATLNRRGIPLSQLLLEQALGEDIKSIQQNAAQTAAKIGQFLLRMQLSLDFLTGFAAIPNDAPRALTPAELRRYNVVNG